MRTQNNACPIPGFFQSQYIAQRSARIFSVALLLLTLAAATQAATVWQNTNRTTILANNSISCNLAGNHANNSYWRAFLPSFYGHTGSFTVSSVRIGIEEALAGSGGSQPFTVRIWANTGGAFPAGTLTLIGTTNTTAANGTLYFQDIPVTATPQPATTEIVVEIFTPDGIAVNNRFFIGSNNLGQSKTSYITAADCGASSPVPVATAGGPNMHTLIALVGAGPTAAGVSVSGRVLTEDGRGLTNATVMLTDMQGQTLTARTSSFGYYLFDDLAAGQMYVISVLSKRYTYTPRAVTANGILSGEDFTPEGTSSRGIGSDEKLWSVSPSFGPSSP